MLVQSAIHFALDYLIQTAYRYFGLSISSNKVWGRNVLAHLPHIEQCERANISSEIDSFTQRHSCTMVRIDINTNHHGRATLMLVLKLTIQ